jgi:hypothetical protein
MITATFIAAIAVVMLAWLAIATSPCAHMIEAD